MENFRKLTNKFFDIGFLKSASILAFGTLFSQAVLFSTTPLLSRLYSPADFGLLAIFTSIVGILSIPITAKLENAIVLPKNDIEAVRIAKTGIFVATFFVIIAFVVALVLYFTKIIEPIYLLAIGCAYLVAMFNIFMFCLHRQQQYKYVSRFLILQTAVLITTNVLCGFFKIQNGLIIGYSLGYLIISILLYLKIRKLYLMFDNVSQKLRSVIIILKKYRTFYIFYVPFQFATLGGQSMIPILLSFYYNNLIVGYFSISNRILRAPFLLFVGSIGNVFKNEAAKAYVENPKILLGLFKKNFLRLLIISIVTFSFIAITCEFIFPRFLGQQWSGAIIYARILCISLSIEIIETPLNFIYTLLGKQKIQFFLQALNIILSLIVLIICAFFKYNPVYAIASFVMVNSVGNIVSINYSYYLLKNDQKVKIAGNE